MPAGDYWLGLAFFVATLGGSIAFATLIVSRRLPAIAGTTRWIAWALLVTGAILFTHLLPAMLTVLSRETAALAAVGLALAASRLPRPEPTTPVGYPEPARESTTFDRLLGMFGVVGFTLWVAAVLGDRLFEEPVGYDAMNAYLPTAATWIQDGSIWGFHDWVPGFFFGSTPGNGTMLLTAAILPWDNEVVARFAMYPFVGFMALALSGLAREVGAPRPAAALLGVMLTAAPVVVYPALRDALFDTVLYATFAAGLLFLVRFRRTDDSADLLLAGLGLGIAFGAKFYGFTAVPIVVGVWLGARLLKRPKPATFARQAALLVAPILLFGGIWVVRNWIETGNPAYPVSIGALGFDAPANPLIDRLGATLADYFDNPSVWTGELRRQFRGAVGIPLLLLGGSIAVATAFLARRRGLRENDDSDGVAVAGIVLAIVLGLSYALTPYTATGAPGDPFLAAANVRYGIPALIAAVGVAGWLCGRLGGAVLTGSCVLFLAGLFDALRTGVLTSRSTVYIAFGLAAVIVAASWLGRDHEIRIPRPDRKTLAVLAGLVLVVAAVIGWQAQEKYFDTRYDQDEVLAELTDAEDLRIGLTGLWTVEEPGAVYPSFGQRLENEVTYLGTTTDGLLRRAATQEEFTEALADGPFDVLLVGLADPIPEDLPAQQEAPPGRPPELDWAESAGYDVILQTDRFALLAAPS